MTQYFKNINSFAANLDQDNIDTDMIIPQDYIKGISRIGLGKHLFAYKRFDSHGVRNSKFILNQSPYNKAEILLVGRNFGCGSSREHAVWALKDFGIKVIIAVSFSDIFYENSIKNFMLPISMEEDELKVIKSISQQGFRLEINLSNQIIKAASQIFSFIFDPIKKKIVLEGLDETSRTLQFLPEIQLFETKQQKQKEWLWN